MAEKHTRSRNHSAKRLADDLAKDSIVTQALSQYLYQVLEFVDQDRIKPLENAISAILREPYGCPFCDSGVLRNPSKQHDSNCGFYMAQKAVAAATGEAP